jgi:hypothetical protein
MTACVTSDLELAGFEMEFVERDGTRRRDLLAQCLGTRFEDVPPVRVFSSARRAEAVSFAGFRWSAKSGRHVGYESWLERDHAMLLDFDVAVARFSSQPFWLHWHDGRRARRHAPDFFARRHDGSVLLVDVRADDQVDEKAAEVFAVTAWICVQIGWEFQRLGELDALFAANVRWLSAYRHPRCRRDGIADRLLEAFARPCPLFIGADEAGRGNRLAALPVLFHLMWNHQLIAANLETRLLGPDTVVTTAGDA